MQPEPTTINMRKIAFIAICVLTGWARMLCAQSQCTVTHYDEFSGMAQWYVTRIIQDKQGMMWFATWNGLNRYDGYEFVCFKSRVGDGIDMASDRIQDMVLMNDGNLLCLVEGVPFVFDIKTCQFRTVADKQRKEYKKIFDEKLKNGQTARITPYYIYKDQYNTQWHIGYDGSLSYQDATSGQQIPYQADGEKMPEVIFNTTDRNGNVWLCSHYGAYKLSFSKRAYKFFPQEKPSQIRFFYIDNKKRYWVTSKDDATIRLFNANNQLLGYLGQDGQLHSQYTSFKQPIYSLTQDSKGVFWLGSRFNGLYRLEELPNGHFNIENFNNQAGNSYSLSDNSIFDIKEDHHGRLWVASFNGGLNCIENPHQKEIVFLNKNNKLKYPKDVSLRVRQIHITADGKMLVATTNGLIIADINNKETGNIVFKRHTKDAHRNNSLSNDATMYVMEDSKHRLYVCTESGGVNQITTKDLTSDKLEFKHFNTSTGFPSDVALSAIPYGNDLLVVSNNQLIILKPDSNDAQNYEAFFWKDKLRFSDATPTSLPDGRTIFGLQDGAFTIRLSEIQKSTFVPPIALTSLSIENGQPNCAVNALDTLILSPKERNITIRFAALDYSADNQILYAFRFGDGDEAWNHIGRDHSATFLDIKPGTYQLQIRSTNSDGVWVDNIRTLTVIVKPTFWETRWAQLLYALLFAAFIWGILRTRRYIRTLNRRQRELHEAYLALLNASNAPKGTAPQQEASTVKPQIKPEDEAFMQRAMKFIEEHIGDSDINIGDMADATATSRSGLNRKMKSLLGVTPLDFIREARIRKACKMLESGSSVNDVAYSCGFADPKYFGKCFKAEMGMTPTEYRNQH